MASERNGDRNPMQDLLVQQAHEILRRGLDEREVRRRQWAQDLVAQAWRECRRFETAQELADLARFYGMKLRGHVSIADRDAILVAALRRWHEAGRALTPEEALLVGVQHGGVA
jgi:hypothetical protein